MNLIYKVDESCAAPSPILEKMQRRFFQKIGLNYDSALARLNDLLTANNLPAFQDSTRYAPTQHWVLFAALANIKIKRILEIGTYTAQTTTLLSALFPAAQIITLDLPDDSPIFIDTYGRKNAEGRKKFVLERNKLLSQLSNVIFLEQNSFLLPTLKLGKFDLIWLDGGHEYPDVAWDMCNCYHSISLGGWLLCDDIYTDKNVPAGATYDTFHVLDCLEKEKIITFDLILKRLHPQYVDEPIERKYIAAIQKNT